MKKRDKRHAVKGNQRVGEIVVIKSKYVLIHSTLAATKRRGSIELTNWLNAESRQETTKLCQLIQMFQQYAKS
jgi:hypothetical protein